MNDLNPSQLSYKTLGHYPFNFDFKFKAPIHGELDSMSHWPKRKDIRRVVSIHYPTL